MYQIAFSRFKEKQDKLIDEYYEKKPGPLGSKDRKCPIDIPSLFASLNEENSTQSDDWAEKSITDWVKTQGTECEAYTPGI